MLGIKQQTPETRSLFLWSLHSTSGKIEKITKITSKKKTHVILNVLKKPKRWLVRKCGGAECSADVTFKLWPEWMGIRHPLMESMGAKQRAFTTNLRQKWACLFKQQQQNGNTRAQGAERENGIRNSKLGRLSQII